MRILLVLLLILYAVKAHSADEVLFIDLNNSPNEVAAARESAEKSGRKLVVLPEMTEKDRKTYRALAEKSKSLMKEYDKVCMGKDPDKDKCEKTRKAWDEAANKQRQFSGPFQVNREKLASFLAANKDKTFSSVVISGHDGTGHFGGSFGGFADIEFAEELSKYPALKDSIRTLHLWGCYTTSPGSLLLNWKKNFPNTSLITGYEGRAPLGDKPAGWYYLKGVLAKEPELLRAGDSAKLQKLLKSIPGANQVNAGIYACDNYASTKDNYNISELRDRCEGLRPEIEKQEDDFMCYLKAQEERCANPPEDVGSGVVRKFYELLHKASACGEVAEDPIFRTYSRDSAIRLVFAREVQNNFGRIYRDKLAEIDEMLAELGAPENLRFKDVGSLSRRELLKRADDLLKFVEKRRPDPMQDPATLSATDTDAKNASLRTFQQNLTSVMTELHPDCVPFNWTEPNQSEKSECVSESLIGKEGVTNLLGPDSDLKENMLSQMRRDLYDKQLDLAKASGPQPNALAQAKLEAISAQVEKVSFYARHGDDPISAEDTQRMHDRAAYVKLLQDLAEKGVKEPKNDPVAVRLAVSINQSKIEGAIEGAKVSIQNLEERLKTIGNSQTEGRKIMEANLENYRTYMAQEENRLEATKIILSDVPWDSKMGKTQRLNELKEAIGRQMRERDIKSLAQNVESAQKQLEKARDANLPVKELDDYKKEVQKFETQIAKLKQKTPGELRSDGQDYLLMIRPIY